MLLVTGYPKTGNTWFLVLMSYIMDPEKMISGNAPQPDNRMFSHCMPKYNTDTYKKTVIAFPHSVDKVLLLIRHPGDTLISLYMHNVYRESPPLFNGTIDQMVHDPVYGLYKFFAYYQWWKHYKPFLKNFYLIRYENLLANPYKVFSKALHAVDIQKSKKVIEDAIEFGKFENMQKLEKINHLDWPTLRPAQKKTKKARKVREGKIGTYKKILRPETISFIENETKNRLSSMYHY